MPHVSYRFRKAYKSFSAATPRLLLSPDQQAWAYHPVRQICRSAESLVGLNECSKATTVCFGPYRPEHWVRPPSLCNCHPQLHCARDRFGPATFLVGWPRVARDYFPDCSLPDMVLALKIKLNYRASPDTAMALLCHVVAHSRGASERGR